MKRYALPILLLVNGALAVWLAWIWFTPQGELRNVRWQPPAAQQTDLSSLLPALPALVQADTGRFTVLLERPLFSSTRRPPPPPLPPPAAAPVDNLSTARLSGVFEGPGGTGIIIQIAGKDSRLQLNQALEGWTLRSVQGRQVTFSSGSETRVMQLPRAALTTYTGRALATVPAPANIQMPRALRPGRSSEEAAAGAGSTPQAAEGAEPLKPRAVFGGSRP